MDKTFSTGLASIKSHAAKIEEPCEKSVSLDTDSGGQPGARGEDPMSAVELMHLLALKASLLMMNNSLGEVATLSIPWELAE